MWLLADLYCWTCWLSWALTQKAWLSLLRLFFLLLSPYTWKLPRFKVCLLWFFSQILMKLSLYFLTNLFLESHIKDTKHPKGNHDISGSIRSLPCLSDGNGTPLLPHMGKVFVPWVTAWKTPQGKRWKQAGIVAFSLWGWHYAWRMSSKEEQKSGDRPPT